MTIQNRLSSANKVKGPDGRGGLPGPSEAPDIWREILIEETHHSTALEGNSLSPAQVAQLLADRAAAEGKPPSDCMEVIGYARAAQWVHAQIADASGDEPTGPLLSLYEVRTIHHWVLQPVWEAAPHYAATDQEQPGSYRQHEIRHFPSGMKPVTWPLIPAEMDAWIANVNRLPANPEAPLEQLAATHCRFEQIHPFLDGNGRTGRLLLNLVLVRLGYPPTVIRVQDREQYLRALQNADRGRPELLVRLINRGMLANQSRLPTASDSRKSFVQ